MSKTETLNKWLAIAQFAAPFVLSQVPHGDKIAPYVPVVTNGIIRAEQKPGATAAEKKAYVMGLAMSAFEAMQASGKLDLDAAQYQAAVSGGVDATIAAINAIHKTHEPVPTGVLLPPSAPGA